MVDNKTVLEWINGVCETAVKEAHNGDRSLMNRIGSNPATKLYFDNVHGLHSVQEGQFPTYYSGQWKEITRLYEEYIHVEAVTEAVDKVDELASRFDKLESMITAFIESQKQPVAEAIEKPAKKGKKAEVEAVTETETDESAESEA